MYVVPTPPSCTNASMYMEIKRGMPNDWGLNSCMSAKAAAILSRTCTSVYGVSQNSVKKK